jgi:hypothetical protein
MTQDRVAFPKVTVIFELNTTLWTATDTSPLSADYVVHHVPVPSESAAGYEFKAEGLENLIRSMGSSFYKLIDLGRAFYCFALIQLVQWSSWSLLLALPLRLTPRAADMSYGITA